VFGGRAAAAKPYIDHAASMWSRVSGAGISRRWVLAVSALVHASLGDVPSAEHWLAEFDADTHPAKVFDFGADLARARVLVTKGFPEDARTAIRAALPAAIARADQASESALLYELLRLDRVDEVVDRLVEIAAAGQGSQLEAMGLHARGLTAGDADVLAEAAALFSAGGFNLYASEAYAHASDAARRAGDQRGATRLLGLAAEERQQCDVVVTQAPIVDVGPVALTRREREIAMLAAQGLASKEIGERLFISRRTAENHLAKVYDKLGVRTRAELARVMDGGVAALAS
jgi:DNA-binding CsgD family transcriptional regulator